MYNNVYTHHSDQLRHHLELSFHLLAGNSPSSFDKIQFLGMVRVRCVSTNEATEDHNSHSENFLGHIVVILGLGTSLALVDLLSFNYLSVNLIRRVIPFKIVSSVRWRHHNSAVTGAGCIRCA